MTAPALADLHAARTLYAAITKRARAAHEVLRSLRSREVLVPCATLASEVAFSRYFDCRYDTSEQYGSVEEFEEALREDLDGTFDKRVVGGVAHYVVRPFFERHPMGTSLNGSKLERLRQACHPREELFGLETAVFEAPPLEPVTGLLREELEALAASYRTRALTLVNNLRVLRTAMHYVRGFLAHEHVPLESLGVTAEVRAEFDELEKLATLPGLPEPARWFGTEADRINPLRKLPADFSAQAVTVG